MWGCCCGQSWLRFCTFEAQRKSNVWRGGGGRKSGSDLLGCPLIFRFSKPFLVWALGPLIQPRVTGGHWFGDGCFITQDGVSAAPAGLGRARPGWAGRAGGFSFPIIQNPALSFCWSLGFNYLCSSPDGDMILWRAQTSGAVGPACRRSLRQPT